MAKGSGIALNVLIPTVTVLSVLLIITLALVGVVLYNSLKKRRQHSSNNSIDDDYSSSWSGEGTCRGLSVRAGRLVRNASRHRLKNHGTRTAIDAITDEETRYSTVKSFGKADDFRFGSFQSDGRASPGIGRALSFGSHKEPLTEHPLHELPDLVDEKGAFMGSADDLSFSGKPNRPPLQSRHTSGGTQAEPRRFQGRLEFQQAFAPNRSTANTPTPLTSVVVASPDRSNSSFTFTPTSNRVSVAFPLSPAPNQFLPLQEPPLAYHDRPSNDYRNVAIPRYNQFRHHQSHSSSDINTEVPLANLATQLSPRTSRPSMPKIEIPTHSSITSRSIASLQRRASSPENRDHIDAHPDFPQDLPVSATRAPGSPLDNESICLSRGTSALSGKENLNQTPSRRPILSRAPSSAVGGHVFHQTSLSTSEAATLASTPPKFATTPRVHSVLLPRDTISASASRTSIVSMSSNASYISMAIGPGGLSPPPARGTSPFKTDNPSEVSVARMVRTSVLGLPMPRLVRVERNANSPIKRQMSFQTTIVEPVTELNEVPETPNAQSPRSVSAFGSHNSVDDDSIEEGLDEMQHEDEVQNSDDDDDEFEEESVYSKERGSGYLYF